MCSVFVEQSAFNYGYLTTVNFAGSLHLILAFCELLSKLSISNKHVMKYRPVGNTSTSKKGAKLSLNMSSALGSTQNHNPLHLKR